DNIRQFKEEGQPTIHGYVTALGKWRVTVSDSKGDPKNIFIEEVPQINRATDLTRGMIEESFKGKSFSEMRNNGDGTTIYFINDFEGEPKLIIAKSGATNSSEIKEKRELEYSLSDVIKMEKTALINNPLYRRLLELDKK